MYGFVGHAPVGQHGPYVGDHAVRAAEEPLVDVVGVEQPVGADEPGEAVRIHPTGQQLGVLWFPGQHVHEVQPGRIPILEVGQFLGEHHRSGVAVAEDDGEPERGSTARPVAISDSTGVMPEPAATAA